MGIGDRKKKKYRTWDDAFRGLIPVIRQQSVRVADYTQVLFAKACEMPCYTKGSNRPPYLFEEYIEVAYKCGLYHQIGKAMLPEESQIWSEYSTEEEKDLYRSYTTEGKSLVARLQGDDEDDEDITVSCQMIRDACEQHKERWNGIGYPRGRERDEISLIAQIVGLARELDKLASGTRSENPFEEAVGSLIARKGTWFSDNLIETMKDCRTELKEVYKKYIQYTETVPKTVPLVEIRAERPFGLSYRSVPVNGEEAGMYEAVPWFRGVVDKAGEIIPMRQVKDALIRTALLQDVTLYLLYEASDTLIRLKNWGFEKDGLLVPVFSAYYREEKGLEKLLKMFEDQQIDKKYLKLTVTANHLEEVAPYMEQGITFVLDSYHPDRVSLAEIQESGITYVRISREVTDTVQRVKISKELQRYGITVVGRNPAYELFTEEELIRYLSMGE